MNYESPNERHKDLMVNIKNYFNQEKSETIFQKRNTIKIVEFEGGKYVVKSFRVPHILNQIVYRFFRDSKARRSFDNSWKLVKMGVNTPQPIGYVEFSTNLRFKESYYISDFFDYDFEIRAVFRDKNFEDRENILKEFMKFTHKLHQKGVYHIDYSPGNILIKKKGYGYEFSIIDVNRMKFLEFDNELCMKSMAKLTNDKEDNNFMLKHYAQISKLDENELKKYFKKALEEQAKYLNNKKKFKKLKGKV